MIGNPSTHHRDHLTRPSVWSTRTMSMPRGRWLTDVTFSQSSTSWDGRRGPLGRRLKFAAGFRPRTLTSGGTVVAAGGMEKVGAKSQPFEERARDWLLIRLDTCLGVNLGFAELATSPVNWSGSFEVQSAGFPKDKSRKVLTLDPSCRVTSVRPLVWLNDCAVLSGNSGSPLFHFVGSGKDRRMQVFAIQSVAILSKKVVPLKAGWDNQATPSWVILPYIVSALSKTR